MNKTVICPNCGDINNHHFVMYYGDACKKCDFDIKSYINKGLYNQDILKRKFKIRNNN